jgi:uncharacterized membrane protein YdjX (TVP38/TMEM64 family)
MINLISGAYRELISIIQANPSLLFCSIAILPGLGFPVSVLFAAAGVVWGTNVKSCSIVMSALALNLTWTYYVMQSPMGCWIRSKIPAKWLCFLDADRGSAFRILLAMRIAPGMPLFIQNYLLGLLKIPFAVYFPVSLLFNSLWACAYMLSGGAFFSGRSGQAFAAISLFILIIILTRLIRSYLAKSMKSF